MRIPPIALRLPAPTLERVLAYRDRMGELTIVAAVRRLVLAGLKAEDAIEERMKL
jgi:hypothetical protein